MSVQEILDRVKDLTAAERQVLREAIDQADRTAQADRDRRGRAAMERLLTGFGTAGGQHLSVGIDDALARADR
ncbi:MAG: hypothetical protein IT204_10955 [Fimbriimonadaceae bacterium]|nr:hypothetical protein [Fimbriimonadaceae bacterium]